ncbi:P-loop NTPase [Microbacterium sp. Leaf436]|uniref:P-loop NTPase n=1 Tax=Microbacterium sp. Leaf436 TaxID=1736377 RepID=UPI0009E77845|nr:SIR2 family protein [Microbacterium sp. Leaf436]
MSFKQVPWGITLTTLSLVEIFSEAEILAVRNAARSGKYQLLLGAGASLGARNRLGKPIPDAKNLVKLLGDRFAGAPIDATTSLNRAYQRAVSSSSEREVWEFLSSRFSGCTHQPWFTELAGLPWRRVWTLNVDDAYERSYRGSARSASSKLRSLNWTDPFVEPNGAEIVHLHGSVSTSGPSPLIFSMKEYTSSASANAAWHIVWRAVIATEPFVIVGARVLDDPDVEHAVIGTKNASSAPSVIVDPYISDGNAWELERAGFKIARMTGEEWVAQWQELCDLDYSSLRALYNASAINLPQFEEYTTDHVRPALATHDFLAGSEPSWSDVAAGKIAEFEWIADGRSKVSSWIAHSGVSKALVVLGERLVGISSGLYAIAHAAASEGARVLWFDRSARFDASALLDFCDGAGPIVIVVESAHTFSSDVDRLLGLAVKRPSVQVLTIMADRSSRSGVIEENLNDGAYSIETISVRTRRPRRDARKVVALLAREGRLDFLERKTTSERIDHFAERDIFSSMNEVERGIGFAARLDSEVRGLTDPWERSLVLLLALASDRGVPVSMAEASTATATAASAIGRRVSGNDHLSALVEINGDVIVPRQRTRGLEALIRLGGGDAFVDELRQMMARLAVLIPKDGYRSRMRASNLVGELMSAKLLLEMFPNADLKYFYQQLLPAYGDWNARFWEQRSILARLTSDWDPAVSFAERATTIWDDGRTRNTLAVNLSAKSRAFAALGSHEWIGLYHRSRGEFENALAHDSNSSLVRFARLRSALELGEALKSGRLLNSVDGQVLVSNWHKDYAEYKVRNFQRLDEQQEAKDRAMARRFESLTASGALSREMTATLNSGLPSVEDDIRRAVRSVSLPISLAKLAATVARGASFRGWAPHPSFKAALMAAYPGAEVGAGPTAQLIAVPARQAADLTDPRTPHRESAAGADLLSVIRKQWLQLTRPVPMKTFADSVAVIAKKRGPSWGAHRKFSTALRVAVPEVELTSESPPRVLPPSRGTKPAGEGDV